MTESGTSFSARDIHFMEMALEEARRSRELDEVPVGVVLVAADGEVLARAGNRPVMDSDPTAHAEVVALRAAGKKVDNYRLINTTLYVTIEPCAMCAGAMIHARIGRLVFGALDPKTGGVVSRYNIGTDGKLNHVMKVEGGLLEEECAELLTSFFKERRG